MKLNIFEYTFDEHDETVAYSFIIPFVSTSFSYVIAQEAPGTTFKKHMAIAKGLLVRTIICYRRFCSIPAPPHK